MSDLPLAAREWIERFDHDWQSGTPVVVEESFRRAIETITPPLGEAEGRGLLTGLIEIDLEHRWRSWSPTGEGDASEWCLEGYARRSPMLGGSGDWSDELIVAEFECRWRWGDQPEITPFLERFPSHRRDQLIPLLEQADRERDDRATITSGRFPQIEGFEIDSRLGVGGFGVVYGGRQPSLRRTVAIKFLSEVGNRDTRVVQRFENEAMAFAGLDHPNIVKIWQIGRHEGSPFLVLEHVGEGTLRDRLKKGPMPWRETAELLKTLADAMDWAHAMNVVHRDLKPENILFGKDGQPKITDFGLAVFGEDRLSIDGQLLGTPEYMSPEQAEGKESARNRTTDVYALGAILYECLAGRPPFQGTMAQVLQQLKLATPKSLASLDRNLPVEIVTICNKCLEKSPEDRFATAARLRDELGRALRGEPLLIKPDRWPVRVRKWAKRQPVQAAALGLALLALLLFAVSLEFVQLWRLATTAREQLAIQLDETDRLKRLIEAQRRIRYEQQHLTATNLIPLLWQTGSHFEIPKLLRSLEPEPGEDDLRAFECHYWKRVTDDLRLIRAHQGSVYGLAVAPQGNLIASAGGDLDIKLWELESGRAVRSLQGHRLPITALAFNRDGTRLVSVACDVERPNLGGEIKVWDVARGREAASAETPRGLLFSVVFGPDSESVISGGVDKSLFSETGTIKVWNTGLSRILHTINRPGQRVFGLALSPDGRHLASGGSPGPQRPGELMLWNTAEWTQVRSLGPQTGEVWGITFTHDGNRLVSSGNGPEISVWDVAGGKKERTLKGHDRSVRKIALSPDGRQLATASFDATVKIWNLESGEVLGTLQGHVGFVQAVQFSPDGRQLISAGTDGTVRLWDGTLGARYITEIPSQKAEFARVAFSPDGQSLAWTSGSSSGRGEIGVWNVALGQRRFYQEEPGTAFDGLAFSPDGRHLAVGTGVPRGRSGSVQVWDLASRTSRQVLDGHANLVHRVAFTSKGQWIVSASEDGRLMIWDAATGQRQKVLDGHRMKVYGLAVSPDGTTLASGAGVATRPGGELKLWNATTGQPLPPIRRETEGVTDLAFSPDGKHLAVAGFHEKALICDLKTREVVFELGHAFMAISVAYSRDGRRIATGEYDGRISLWDAGTGRKLLTMTGLNAPVNSVAFSPNGLQLAAAGRDGKIVLWNASPPVLP